MPEHYLVWGKMKEIKTSDHLDSNNKWCCDLWFRRHMGKLPSHDLSFLCLQCQTVSTHYESLPTSLVGIGASRKPVRKRASRLGGRWGHLHLHCCYSNTWWLCLRHIPHQEVSLSFCSGCSCFRRPIWLLLVITSRDRSRLSCKCSIYLKSRLKIAPKYILILW